MAKKTTSSKLSKPEEIIEPKIKKPRATKKKVLEITNEQIVSALESKVDIPNTEDLKSKRDAFLDAMESFIKSDILEDLGKLEEEEAVHVLLPEATHILAKEGEWDVRAGDELFYFDPELSYEATGYRPLTMEKGLDFDVTPFIEAGQVKEKTGKYCEFRPGTKLYMDYWKEQMNRVKSGYTVGKYTITGDHYYFLNFYRILNISKVGKAGTGRPESFPNFIAKQYEYFHYISLAEYYGFDVVALKARGVGFSEIGAALGVSKYTSTKQSKVLYSAHKQSYLDDVLDKCWTQLSFLNSSTEGGFRRIRQKADSFYEKRASKVDRDGNEFGHMASIMGLVADNPNKLRGARVERLFFEEAGSDPVLIKKFLQAEALVKLQGTRIGTRILWGTGGDSGPALEGLSKMFYEPSAFGILPYKHNYTQEGNYVYTSFFIPAYTVINKPGFVDERGVTNSILGREYYQEERKKKAVDLKTLSIYKAEFCFTPEEALSQQGENQFDKERITEQMAAITLYKTVPLPEKGKFLRNREGGDLNWTKSETGKVYIAEHPIMGDDGKPYKNLYVAGIDSIDAGTQDSSDQMNRSEFCIVIKKRTFGTGGNQYVAIYKDRPKDVREAYNIAIKLLEYYNCKAVLESTRIGIITHMRNLKKVHLLMQRPRATLADVKAGNSKMFGTPATETIIRHYLELIENYVNDYCENIPFLEMLEQLCNYNYVSKGKFDIIAAMGMCELGDEELQGVIPQKINKYKEEFRDIGSYIDEYGRKRWGIIPKKYHEYPRIEMSDIDVY